MSWMTARGAFSEVSRTSNSVIEAARMIVFDTRRIVGRLDDAANAMHQGDHRALFA